MIIIIYEAVRQQVGLRANSSGGESAVYRVGLDVGGGKLRKEAPVCARRLSPACFYTFFESFLSLFGPFWAQEQSSGSRNGVGRGRLAANREQQLEMRGSGGDFCANLRKFAQFLEEKFHLHGREPQLRVGGGSGSRSSSVQLGGNCACKLHALGPFGNARATDTLRLPCGRLSWPAHTGRPAPPLRSANWRAPRGGDNCTLFYGQYLNSWPADIQLAASTGAFCVSPLEGAPFVRAPRKLPASGRPAEGGAIS